MKEPFKQKLFGIHDIFSKQKWAFVNDVIQICPYRSVTHLYLAPDACPGVTKHEHFPNLQVTLFMNDPKCASLSW